MAISCLTTSPVANKINETVIVTTALLCASDEYTRQRLLLTTHFRYTFLKEQQLTGQ